MYFDYCDMSELSYPTVGVAKYFFYSRIFHYVPWKPSISALQYQHFLNFPVCYTAVPNFTFSIGSISDFLLAFELFSVFFIPVYCCDL